MKTCPECAGPEVIKDGKVFCCEDGYELAISISEPQWHMTVEEEAQERLRRIQHEKI